MTEIQSVRRFADRVAVVTGAGGGIGRATARLLADEGAAVAVVDIDGGAAETTRAEIEKSGGAAVAIVADVASDDDCVRSIEQTVGELGRLDVLVNNAAVLTPQGAVADLPVEVWNRVLGVSLTGVFLMSRHAIPALRDTGGVIVNLASVHAFATMPAVAAYAAAKGGVLALTRQMAIDLAPDRVRVVAVAPGAVDTRMLRGEGNATDDELAAGFPFGDRVIGRVGRPEEIAAVIAFAASDAASFVTGTALVADGGLLAKLV